jgi:hypothetical protein
MLGINLNNMKSILRIITLVSALFVVSPAFAVCTAQFLGGTVCGNNTTSQGVPGPTANPVLGVPGTNTGTLGFAGSSSGTVTITPQAAAGSANLTLPTGTGTFAVTASGPLVLNAVTGALTCPTCVTGTTNAITNGVTPTSGYSAGQLIISNGTVVSAVTPAAGQILAGSTPAFTATPVLGVPTSLQGTLGFAGVTSGTATLTAQAIAGTPTITLPNTSGTVADGASSPLVLSATTGNLTLSGLAGGVLAGAAPAFTITPVLGVPGSSTGTLGFAGVTSGTVTITPQATAGSPTLTLPNTTGTFADGASAPLALSATTGNLTCITCVTSSGGGAITGSAPIAVSAAGVVSINAPYTTLVASNGGIVYSGATNLAILSGTATANQMLMSGATAAPIWSTSTWPNTVSTAGQVLNSTAANVWGATATPTLGVAGSVVGTIAHANATSGTITVTPPTGALGSSVNTLQAVTDTFVYRASTDTLTNKTIASSTDVLGGVTMTLGSDATGDIYYRASTGILTRLPIGSASNILTVSGGLPAWTAATGGGNVSNSGTPTAGQLAEWTNATTIQGFVTPNYLGGLVLSNDGTAPNSVLDIASGSATDSTNAQFITIGAFTKSTQGAWAAGSGSNGMGNGLTIANNTGYHVCLTPNGGSPDIWFDTSAVCANKPVGVSGSLFRRIGSFRTNPSGNILAFTQNGDWVTWAAAINELNTTTPATSLTALSLVGVPQGIATTALLRGIANSTTASNELLIANGGETSAIDSVTGNRTVEVNVASVANAFQVFAVTNASNQIKYQATSATWNVVAINTFGYIDTRGK